MPGRPSPYLLQLGIEIAAIGYFMRCHFILLGVESPLQEIRLIPGYNQEHFRLPIMNILFNNEI